MPIPDTPYTRKEAYLNAAATGDSSGIPETPYTREEMYLDAIARNGGGGGGGGGGAFVVEMVWDDSTSTYTLDTKAGVIFDTAKTGLVIFQEKVDGEVVAVYLLIYCYNDMEAGYGFYVSDTGFLAFMANSADDYPTYHVD